MVFVCLEFLTEILAHKYSEVSWTSKVTSSKKPAAYEQSLKLTAILYICELKNYDKYDKQHWCWH